MSKHFSHITNNQSVALEEIPVLRYDVFFEEVSRLLAQPVRYHCVHYFSVIESSGYRLIIIIADDREAMLAISSHRISNAQTSLLSLTERHFSMHVFERELHENLGIDFIGHPWPKPLRYAANRHDTSKVMAGYPFYRISSEELHEVGVGPIHAGVIEPGHFRFLCSGEDVLHLEIQLGYQHRGIESLLTQSTKLNQRHVLAESIAGDTTIGHNLAFTRVVENLMGVAEIPLYAMQRSLALGLERVAIHTANLSAACGDIAYQLGSAVFGALRTPLINFFQTWCGNRFGRSLIRAGQLPYPLTAELSDKLLAMLADVELKFEEMASEMLKHPSVQLRLERTGKVTREQMLSIGAVGIPARAVGIQRDIRYTHPAGFLKAMAYSPVTEKEGDTMAIAKIRCKEVRKSIVLMRQIAETLQDYPQPSAERNPGLVANMKPLHLSVSMVEAWRGELAHVIVTDAEGKTQTHKIKDPSMHNWLALALAVRNNEISDFPICNKSYDQSYCGHDL